MRRLIVLLGIILSCASRVDAAATLKQVVGTCQSGGASSCNITPGVAITAGDGLVAIAGLGSSSATLSSVTATGHTFTVLDNFSVASGSSIGSAYECNAAGGTPTITITASASTAVDVVIYEVQGNATSACIDGHTGQGQTSPGTGANGITSTTVTPTNNGVFFMGGTMSQCCTPPTVTAGTSVAWTNTQTVNDTQTQLTTEEFAQATAAALAATFTQSANVRATTLIVGIAPSGGGGGSTPPPKLLLLGVGAGE